MNEPYMSWPEAAWLIMGYTLCANYLFVPQMLYAFAGRSAWVITIAAALPGLIGAWAAYALHARCRGHRIGEYLPRLLGKPLGTLIGLVYSLYWVGGAAINVVVFSQYVSATVMTLTPNVVMALSSVVILVMVALYGMKTLVRLSDLLLFVVVPFLLSVALLPLFSGKLDWGNLVPFDVVGALSNPLPITAAAVCMYHGYLMILVAGPALNPPGRRALWACILGTMLSVPFFIMFVSYPVLAFGWPYARCLTYPAAAILEVVSPRTAFIPIRRYDFVLTMLLRPLMNIAAMSYFFSACQTLTDVIAPKYGRPHLTAVLALAAVIMVSAYLIADVYQLLEVVRIWVLLGAVVVTLTIILAIIASIVRVNVDPRTAD